MLLDLAAVNDSLFVKFINITPQPETNKIVNFLPWITAIIVAILSSIINIYIAYRLRKSNNINLLTQLKSNEHLITLQYQSSFETKNRQEWLNELRNSVSEFISKIIIILLDKNKTEFDNNTEINLERLFYLKSKIELLLNLEKESHVRIITYIDNIISKFEIENINVQEISLLRLQLIREVRELIDHHWKKIEQYHNL